MRLSRFVCLLMALCALTPLGAKLEDYLKIAEEKGECHSMPGVDFIYTINLDDRPEKWEMTRQELAPYNIHPYRFSAVNGWEIPIETLSKIGVRFKKGMRKGIQGTQYRLEDGGEPRHSIINKKGETYVSRCLSRGAIGIILSHLSIIYDALQSGYKTIWVMEDDIRVIRNPHEITEKIRQLDKKYGKHGWDILFTDRDTINKDGEYVPCKSGAKRPNFTPRDKRVFRVKKDIGGGLRQVGARYGAYSMIIKRSGMQKIFHFLKKYKIFLPYDMDFIFPEGIKMFTVTDDIVSTRPDALSDNGVPNYRKKSGAM